MQEILPSAFNFHPTWVSTIQAKIWTALRSPICWNVTLEHSVMKKDSPTSSKFLWPCLQTLLVKKMWIQHGLSVVMKRTNILWTTKRPSAEKQLDILMSSFNFLVFWAQDPTQILWLELFGRFLLLPLEMMDLLQVIYFFQIIVFFFYHFFKK